MADNTFNLDAYLAEPTNATGTYYPVTVLAVSVMVSAEAEPSTNDLYHIGVVESINLSQTRNIQTIRQIEAYPNTIMGRYNSDKSYNFGFVLGDRGQESFFPGETVLIVPGGLGDLSLRVKRVDFVNSLALEALLWTKTADGEPVSGYETIPEDNYVNINNVNDYGRIITLLLQRRPFSIFEFIFNPAKGKAAPIQDGNSGEPSGIGIAYQDGWIKSTGHQLQIGGGGNITTAPDMDIAITRIRPFKFYTKTDTTG